MPKSRRDFYLVLAVCLLGFVLHFTWEYLQCAPFFKHGEPNPNLFSMLVATLGDVLMLMIVYLVDAILLRSFSWAVQTWSMKTIIIIVVPSVLLASIVEILGLQTARWRYTSQNPLIPVINISLLPVLQMAILNPTLIYVSKKIISALCRYKNKPEEAL